MPDQYNTNCVSHCTELQHFASQTLSCWCCWNDCFLNEYKSVWFYSLAVPVTPFFAVFSFIKVVCTWTFLISEPFNMQPRLLLMNGKIKALHFFIISFAVSCCLSPWFIWGFFSFLLLPPTFTYFLFSHHVSLCVLLEIHSPPLIAFLLLSSSCLLTHPSLYPPHLSIFQSPPVLWWGAGWPWIPLLLWGNNRPSLLLCVPLSPTWGPQSTGKEGAREMGNTSRVCGREGEWERY